MGARTEYRPGTFCWVELATADLEAARGFYPALLGWELEDDPISFEEPYLRATMAGRPVAAMFDPPSQRGRPARWASYVSVEDADATAARAADLGGRVAMGPFDVRDAARISRNRGPAGRGARPVAATRGGGRRARERRGRAHDEPAEHLGSRRRAELLHRAVRMELRGGVGAAPLLEHPERRDPERRHDAELRTPPRHRPTGSSTSPAGDLEDSARRVAENGGRVIVPATAIPAGRFLRGHRPSGSRLQGLFEGEVDP